MSTLGSTVGEGGLPDHARSGDDPREVPAGRRFQIDSARSRIGFAVRHFKIVTVRGRFTDYSGGRKHLHERAAIESSSRPIVLRFAVVFFLHILLPSFSRNSGQQFSEQ